MEALPRVSCAPGGRCAYVAAFLGIGAQCGVALPLGLATCQRHPKLTMMLASGGWPTSKGSAPHPDQQVLRAYEIRPCCMVEADNARGERATVGACICGGGCTHHAFKTEAHARMPQMQGRRLLGGSCQAQRWVCARPHACARTAAGDGMRFWPRAAALRRTCRPCKRCEPHLAGAPQGEMGTFREALLTKSMVNPRVMAADMQ